MKHNLKNMIRHKLSVMMLLFAMLTVSNAAWGTYYLYHWTSDNDVCSGNITPIGASGSTVTLDNSSNNFIGVSETEDDYYTNTKNMSGTSKSDPNNIVSNFNGSQGYGCWGSVTHEGNFQFVNIQLYSTQTVILSYDGSTMTITPDCSGNTVNSTVSSNGTISPNGSSCVTSSKEYSVTLDTHYKVKSVTNTAGGTLSPTASELVGRTGSFTVTLSSPSSNGDLTITTEACGTNSVTVTASGGAVSPTGAQTIYEGDSKNFTVTPTTGYVYKRYTTSGGFAGTVSKTDNTFTVTPTAGGIINIEYVKPGLDVPIARIGERIKMKNGTDVAVSGYVTSEKCYDVDEIVVYYSNNSAFRTEGSMVAKNKSFTPVSPATEFDINSVHELILPSEDVETIVGNGETLYVRIKAHNEQGYSAYSDVVNLVYENNSFEANAVGITPSDACDGNHEFTWSDMFLPTPTDYAVIDAFGNNVKGEFSLTEDGQMVWNVIESIGDDGTVNIKPNGTYTFTFTAKRNGYTSANAVLTINFATSGTEDAITGITFNSEGVKTEDGSLTPWETATLGATESSGDIVKIGWTVSPVSDSYILTPTEGTSVKFKGKAAGIYTVTARGLTSTCGSSKSKTIELTVNNDSEPCN